MLHMLTDLMKSIDEVKQDKEIKDKEGTQPAKYYAGDMAKSTKDKRDAHFKQRSLALPLAMQVQKPNHLRHTKKFKQMYGEVLPEDADQGDYIDDFVNSRCSSVQG